MRTIRKRILGLLALCFMALSLYPKVPVQAAYAGILGYEQNLKDGFRETIVYNPSDAQGYYEVNADGIYGHTCKNRKAVSSDKKIVTVKYSPVHQCFLLTPKKTGTAKVTFSAVRKGKKVTCQGTVKVVKFQNPVKSLKINGKNYAKEIKTTNAVLHIKTKKPTAAFHYKLQPGWKVESAYGEILGEDNPLGIYREIKNKETYSLQEGNLLIRMTLKNTKRGEQVHIALSVER